MKENKELKSNENSQLLYGTLLKVPNCDFIDEFLEMAQVTINRHRDQDNI